MSKNEEVQNDDSVNIPLSNMDSILLIIDSILAKGGHSSRDVLKTTIGKANAIVDWALSAATGFGLIEYTGKEYSLTPVGNKVATQSENDRKQSVRELVLNNPAYHTILLRLKNAPNSTLTKTDITKAWFELTKSGKEGTRERYTASFGSICEWCGLVENGKKKVVLTEDGKALLSGAVIAKTLTINDGDKPLENIDTDDIKNTEKSKTIKAQITETAEAQTMLNTTITINISVDTKEQAAVENLIKIIKTLKGEKN